MIPLQKIDSTCGNINLIDENTCLGNSINIVNSNVATLCANLQDLTRNLTYWKNIYSIYTQLSSYIISTGNSLESIKNKYIDYSTTVKTLSSFWQTPLYLFFPTIYSNNLLLSSAQTNGSILYDLVNGGNSSSPTSNNPPTISICDWLKNNFSPTKFIHGQIINVYVNFYNEYTFNYDFKTIYIEECKPNGKPTTVTCNGCPGDPLASQFQACNQNLASGHVCSNAYSHCPAPVSNDAQTLTYSCAGSKPVTMTISYTSGNLGDKYICDTLIFKYQNNRGKNSWTSLNI